MVHTTISNRMDTAEGHLYYGHTSVAAYEDNTEKTVEKDKGHAYKSGDKNGALYTAYHIYLSIL